MATRPWVYIIEIYFIVDGGMKIPLLGGTTAKTTTTTKNTCCTPQKIRFGINFFSNNFRLMKKNEQ